MKDAMSDAIAKLDGTGCRQVMSGHRGGGHTMDDLSAKLRDIYTGTQWSGEFAFYERAQPHDGPDCLFVAIIAVKGGALVRVPVLRNVGASFAAEVIRGLA